MESEVSIKVGDKVAWAVTRYKSGYLRQGIVETINDRSLTIKYNTECRTGLTSVQYLSDVVKVTVAPPLHTKETVTITVSEYKSILDDQFKLECLESAGVDNWEGYDIAMREYRGDNDQ